MFHVANRIFSLAFSINIALHAYGLNGRFVGSC